MLKITKKLNEEIRAIIDIKLEYPAYIGDNEPQHITLLEQINTKLESKTFDFTSDELKELIEDLISQIESSDYGWESLKTDIKQLYVYSVYYHEVTKEYRDKFDGSFGNQFFGFKYKNKWYEADYDLM